MQNAWFLGRAGKPNSIFTVMYGEVHKTGKYIQNLYSSLKFVLNTLKIKKK